MQLNADNLTKIRHAYRLTQTRVAEMAGVGVPYINQIEHKRLPMTDRIRARLTEALRLTPDIIQKIDDLDAELNGKQKK